jgi:predicted lactoylglutathione lyase
MITIGNLIDQLTIANIRIWMCEDIKRNKDATDKQIADATRTTNITNGLRTDLIQSIDEMLNDLSEGKKQKLYKQGASKMYGKKD